MKLSVKALSLTCALIWGGGVAFAAFAHLAISSYGTTFLAFLGSIYPGFHGPNSVTDVLTGTGYALVDGCLGGAMLAWLYNLFAPLTSVSGKRN